MQEECNTKLRSRFLPPKGTAGKPCMKWKLHGLFFNKNEKEYNFTFTGLLSETVLRIVFGLEGLNMAD